jgi:2,4-dienoyl-CoA reductase (NADPH2)
VAERILAGADMVSMARPFLADPEFVIKAAEDRADEINTCIACNQACPPRSSKACLLPGQPRACHETELTFGRCPAQEAGRGGRRPGGLAFACHRRAAIR